jgi:hypothetical protein
MYAISFRYPSKKEIHSTDMSATQQPRRRNRRNRRRRPTRSASGSTSRSRSRSTSDSRCTPASSSSVVASTESKTLAEPVGALDVSAVTQPAQTHQQRSKRKRSIAEAALLDAADDSTGHEQAESHHLNHDMSCNNDNNKRLKTELAKSFSDDQHIQDKTEIAVPQQDSKTHVCAVNEKLPHISKLQWKSGAAMPKLLRKYWNQRYSLFSRFDQGIAMDRGISSG